MLEGRSKIFATLIRVVFVLIAMGEPTPCYARRQVYVALPHSNEWLNNAGAWMDYECHIINPSGIRQTISIDGYYVNGRPNELKTSPQKRSLVGATTLNSKDSYNWYERTDAPIGPLQRQPSFLEITVQEDDGFLIGGCMYSSDFQMGVTTGAAVTSQSGLEVLINGGKAF